LQRAIVESTVKARGRIEAPLTEQQKEPLGTSGCGAMPASE
jgi:hypothetical protein